jgi:F-type H+-transporting ATPase subunit delta
MPAKTTTARRYAEAAFQLAERDDAVDAWMEDLRSAVGSLSGEDVQRILANPSIPARRRIEIAERILGDRVARGPLNLVRVLLLRGRIDRLPDVAREFQRLRDRRAGITQALVTSAVPLDEGEAAALRERLAPVAGGRIEMTMQVDRGILGGVVVRLGDRLIDGSVRSRLERLRARLATGAL